MWWSTCSSPWWKLFGKPSGGSARVRQETPRWLCECSRLIGKRDVLEKREMSPATVLFHPESGSFKLCVLFAVMMSQRSVSLSPAWFCCANMTRCCAGAETVTTVCTRAWWRSLFLTSSGPSPVRLYKKCAKAPYCQIMSNVQITSVIPQKKERKKTEKQRKNAKLKLNLNLFRIRLNQFPFSPQNVICP